MVDVVEEGFDVVMRTSELTDSRLTAACKWRWPAMLHRTVCLHVVWSSDRYITPKLRAFIDYLRANVFQTA